LDDFSHDERCRFGSKVVSSVSLQGMDVDEAPDTRQRFSLKAGTTSSLNSRASKRSKKSLVPWLRWCLGNLREDF
jgi:hypothetical protein